MYHQVRITGLWKDIVAPGMSDQKTCNQFRGQCTWNNSMSQSTLSHVQMGTTSQIRSRQCISVLLLVLDSAYPRSIISKSNIWCFSVKWKTNSFNTDVPFPPFYQCPDPVKNPQNSISGVDLTPVLPPHEAKFCSPPPRVESLTKEPLKL